MSRASRYMHLTQIAQHSERTWSNRDRALFHRFNPHGVYAQWRKMCDIISAHVAIGDIPSGWILAHGGLNDYAAKRLIALSDRPRIGTIDLRVAVDMLSDQIEIAYRRLNEKLGTSYKN